MPPFKKHIFICTNTRPEGHPTPSCGPKGGLEVQKAFKEKLAALGLKSEIRANQSGCLDACAKGVVLVIYPQGIWYQGVTTADIDEIIEKSIKNDDIIARLAFNKPNS